MRKQAWLVPSLFILGVLLGAAGCSQIIGREATAFGMEDGGSGTGGPGGGIRDLSIDRDAFWAQDPPPMYCGLDGGMLPQPQPPGGTPECPDDKNRQACPCKNPGEVAACWPGLRKNRNLGICHDGQTTCIQTEVGSMWGPCEGYVLPVPGAMNGAAACNCFSAGRWQIDNVVPCFYTQGGKLRGASSSVTVDGQPSCIDMPDGPLSVPPAPWSKNTLQVDCVGHFKLCYTLKAGDYKNPQPSDCTIATICTEGDYASAHMTQELTKLPAWVTTTAAQVSCAEQFMKTGGYGEMDVDGLTVTCEKVKKVFNRMNYCPLSCNETPTAPECQNCGDGGSGTF